MGADRARPAAWLSRVLIGMRKSAALLLVALVAGCGQASSPDAAGDPGRGESLFSATCAECHGVAGVGTDKGPPLVDPIYRPGHHSDAAFLLAVRQGVLPHHWGFGTMPPQEGLSDADVADIVAYVRGLQRAAGIE